MCVAQFENCATRFRQARGEGRRVESGGPEGERETERGAERERENWRAGDVSPLIRRVAKWRPPARLLPEAWRLKPNSLRLLMRIVKERAGRAVLVLQAERRRRVLRQGIIRIGGAAGKGRGEKKRRRFSAA